jgi:hypothetical protein
MEKPVVTLQLIIQKRQLHNLHLLASVVPEKMNELETKQQKRQILQKQTTKAKSQSAKNAVLESWGPFSSSCVVGDREEERQSTLDLNGHKASSEQRSIMDSSVSYFGEGSVRLDE